MRSLFLECDLQDVLPDSDPRSLHEDIAKFYHPKQKGHLGGRVTREERDTEEKFKNHGLQLSATESFNNAIDLTDNAILTGSVLQRASSPTR